MRSAGQPRCCRPLYSATVAVEGPDLFARAWMVWQGSKAPASESCFLWEVGASSNRKSASKGLRFPLTG
ncbi:hypothetical protein AAC387_Pa05g2770 [Persea americana]